MYYSDNVLKSEVYYDFLLFKYNHYKAFYKI